MAGLVFSFIRPQRRAARLAWIFLGCLLAIPAHADLTGKPEDKKEKKKKKDAGPQFIPEVRDMSATFVAGQSVQIELSASTGTLKPAEFLIRQQPANGTLSAVRSHPRETNKAIVTYTHRGGDAPLSDRFTFACRVDGGPVSASAWVLLVGKRFEPKLQLVDFMAVDKVFTGGEATVRFSLRNVGAADFAENISWEAPWQGPARIELKAGESGRYLVQFRPEKPGIYRLEKILQPGVDGSKLPLYAQCVRPLTLSPGRLILTPTSSGAREGELQLVNGRQDPVVVQVQASGRLQGGGTIEVPGGGKARVSLALPPLDVAAFHGEVKVTSAEGSETVLVESTAKPANLQVVMPQGTTLDLGRIPAGREGQGAVRLRNIGGLAAVIQAQVRSPLSVTPSGEAVRLEPGAEAEFIVKMIGDQPGSLLRELSFTGNPASPRIQVQMEVGPPESPLMPPAEATASNKPPVAISRGPQPPVFAEVEPRPDSPVKRLMYGYLGSAGIPVARERINPFLERVTALDLLDRRSHSLTIAWKKPSVMPSGWIIEVATMAQAEQSGGSFVKLWTPLKNWKLVNGGSDRVTALIDPLPPSVQIELRIMGVDRDEKISEPSPGFVMTTAESWRIPSWLWQVMAAVLLTGLAYVLNKIRLGEWEWRLRRQSRTDVTEAPAHGIQVHPMTPSVARGES
ncbi:MAG TPA: hypothetical protein VGH65_07095 [Verrucomicrobiaceae bacterium]